jgi:hypothetical protein
MADLLVYGRALHRVDPRSFPPATQPPRLWIDDASRRPRELPIWALNARQIALAERAEPGMAYRLLRIANVVGLAHNHCLVSDALGVDALLAVVDPDLRGFAVEGIGMGLTTRTAAGGDDLLGTFLEGSGAAFLGLPYTGIGMGLAHNALAFSEDLVDRHRGLSRWMILDGLAFWGARQDWEARGVRFEAPDGVSGPALAFFDRGLGRCGWFQLLGRVADVAGWIASAPEARRGWLWYGVGVAATFTGGVEIEDLQALRAAAGDHRPDLAAGSIQGADVRAGAGIDTAYTARACGALSGLTVEAARRVGAEVRRDLGGDDSVEAARTWVTRIKATVPSSGEG